MKTCGVFPGLPEAELENEISFHQNQNFDACGLCDIELENCGELEIQLNTCEMYNCRYCSHKERNVFRHAKLIVSQLNIFHKFKSQSLCQATALV